MHQKSTSAAWGSAPDSAGPGSLQRSPRPPSWNKGDLLLSEGEKYRNEKGGQGAGRRRERTREGEGNAEDPPYVSLNFP